MTDNTSLPFSQVPGHPTFRDMAVNAVAMIPLLSTDKQGLERDSFSAKSFRSLIDSLHHYSRRNMENILDTSLQEVDIQPQHIVDDTSIVEDLLLVVPNAQLTRPGDWRYDNTPLKHFHWGHGCQRLLFFDGRPHCNRMAHDRLINPTICRDWIDLYPSRRTAAVIGILNVRDLTSLADLQRAEQELSTWAQRYSTPPYELTHHGRSFARDEVVQRLFVFDSFEELPIQVNLSKTKLGSRLVAFPPPDSQHSQMMDLHLNVVVNDLAVTIFRQLERKIQETDALSKDKQGNVAGDPRVKTHSLLNVSKKTDEPMSQEGNLSVANIANVVSPGNKLAATCSTTSNTRKNNPPPPPPNNPLKSMVESAGRAMHVPNRRHPPTAPQLLTPLDHVWDLSELNPRDADAMKRQLLARREKLAADFSLLAGSPMDAYERYSHAASLCKASPDPLWYAAALVGCAAAHIAMAEAGGYHVDAYLEQNFQLPEEFMACATLATLESRKPTNKQTLPAVVFALCEEALHISNRHVKLAPIHAELLLKLAAYIANDDEAHMRCRWGEGEGCYPGDANDLPRWDRASVSQLAFQELKGKDGEDMVAASTFRRLKMWTRLLHRAVSTGGLAPLTRADVAATCTRLCLKGMLPTQWKNRPKRERIQLLRKAAYFATVAAEGISQCSDMESTLQASGLWLTVSQFYSRKSNANGIPNYGWATLRASSLYALSQQEDKVSSEAAAEMLLALLSEMAPEQMPSEKVDLRASLKALDMALQFDDPPMSSNSRHNTDAPDDRSETEQSIMSLSSRYSSYSKATGKTSMSIRNNFFAQQPTAAASLLTVAQAKWADDEPIPQIDLPLIDADQEGGVLSLNCVLPKIKAQHCAAAQKDCIVHISKLRRDMAIISSSTVESKDPHYALSLSGSPEKGEPIVPPPLDIISAAVVPSESHLVLERYKADSKAAKEGAMATFYNPYDKSKEGDKKIATTLVAVGEERELTIEFSNHLAVPLDVPSCQIEFDCGNSSRIKAPALSFVIPPKAKKFAVQFPFIVLNSDHSGEEDDSVNADEAAAPDMIDVKGLWVTCLSRLYFILVKHENKMDRQVPDPASVYQRRQLYDAARHEEMVRPRIEVVPAQPNLVMKFATSETEIVDGISIPVQLCDGETFSLPSFRIINNFGSTGGGAVERLQIVGVGVPGVPDEVLFDTLSLTNDDSGKDLFFESHDEDSEKGMDSDEGPPLKMKVLSDGLSLARINDKSSSPKNGSIVKFQMIASHDFGNHVGKSGNVRLRVRYRGSSADPAAEIWRKTEVHQKIVRVSGPRISSLAFRPDLNWKSAYSQLSMALSKQLLEYENMKAEWKMTDDHDAPSEGDSEVKVDTTVLSRIGLDSGVHVSSREVALVMSVANETDSTIVLSNRKGLVGGFDVSPMPTVKIASGVSAKIPVVIPRIKRADDNDGCAIDVVDEVVSQLSLQWETINDEAVGDSEVTARAKMRQGRIRIPSACLREIIRDHPSFVPKICEPPVSVKVNVGRDDCDKCLVVSPGSPVETFVEVETADWVPADVAEKCRITIEFCAAQKDKETKRGDFVWCGLVRRTMRLNDPNKDHRARIVFLKDSEYVVSACARLTNDDGNKAEETWWAPVAENVVVVTSHDASQ